MGNGIAHLLDQLPASIRSGDSANPAHNQAS
jgi:hypothetical protein